eukprot:353299-Chlamydomonas_euryale.AAC.18
MARRPSATRSPTRIGPIAQCAMITAVHSLSTHASQMKRSRNKATLTRSAPSSTMSKRNREIESEKKGNDVGLREETERDAYSFSHREKGEREREREAFQSHTAQGASLGISSSLRMRVWKRRGVDGAYARDESASEYQCMATQSSFSRSIILSTDIMTTEEVKAKEIEVCRPAVVTRRLWRGFPRGSPCGPDACCVAVAGGGGRRGG